jgi:hypothetical protein
MKNVRVLPGNPVSDGHGNVYRTGMTFRLPPELARNMVAQGRVEIVDDATTIDEPLATHARVTGVPTFR